MDSVSIMSVRSHGAEAQPRTHMRIVTRRFPSTKLGNLPPRFTPDSIIPYSFVLYDTIATSLFRTYGTSSVRLTPFPFHRLLLGLVRFP